MFEASVEVGLSFEDHDMVEMRVVDMCVHSEEAFEDNLDNIDEILWEPDSDLAGEDLFV